MVKAFRDPSHIILLRKSAHSVSITDSSQFIDLFQHSFDQTSDIFTHSVYKCVRKCFKLIPALWTKNINFQPNFFVSENEFLLLIFIKFH